MYNTNSARARAEKQHEEKEEAHSLVLVSEDKAKREKDWAFGAPSSQEEFESFFKQDDEWSEELIEQEGA